MVRLTRRLFLAFAGGAGIALTPLAAWAKPPKPKVSFYVDTYSNTY